MSYNACSGPAAFDVPFHRFRVRNFIPLPGALILSRPHLQTPQTGALDGDLQGHDGVYLFLQRSHFSCRLLADRPELAA